MIIEKNISFNFNNIDEVILTLAEDINKGFTVDKMERLPLTLCTKTFNTEPACEITLRRKDWRK